jgi:hypothetical protein
MMTLVTRNKRMLKKSPGDSCLSAIRLVDFLIAVSSIRSLLRYIVT